MPPPLKLADDGSDYDQPDEEIVADKVHDNQCKAMLTRLGKFKICFMTSGGKSSEGALIYIALSKSKKESLSHLRKQLNMIHSMIISAGTGHIISSLKSNPNFDILNNPAIRDELPTITQLCDYLWQDPATLLNLYLPLRLHPMSRNAVNNVILRHKPTKIEDYAGLEENENKATVEGEDDPKEEDEVNMDSLYYYGVIIVKHSVVTVFKNNPDIAVTPADLNILINYSIFNVENKYEEDGSKKT